MAEPPAAPPHDDEPGLEPRVDAGFEPDLEPDLEAWLEPDAAARADYELLRASRTDPAAFRAFYDQWS
ncbi:hypothetical protein, partial [Acetobacter senegalensis]|uniref:hypothetical protein n=1 Tax=Acetobacter senegalensis TaxID=446692 RepID=UPI001EDAC298